MMLVERLNANVLVWTWLLAAAAAPCSCSSLPRPAAVTPACELPAPVEINQPAGKGMLLFVPVRLENGQEFPFALDTGSPNTMVPDSLESTLGKRLASRSFRTLDGAKETEHLYRAPRLFLGNTPLMTEPEVGAWHAPIGVLGMDCLRHYCVQLDFQARQVRFLNSVQLKPDDLGEPFSLLPSPYAMIKRSAFFQDGECDLLVDTGCWADGCVQPGVFRRLFRRGAHSIPLMKDGAIRRAARGFALVPECVWEGQTYSDLVIGKGPNLLGLKFLARHLVTFDFPNGRLYLQKHEVSNLLQGRLLHECSGSHIH